MTGYQISQRGEPVAFVASFDLARQIAFCQPPGFYVVDEIPVGPVVGGTEPAAGRRRIRRSPARNATTQPPRKVSQPTHGDPRRRRRARR
jgi:hypothetical protein